MKFDLKTCERIWSGVATSDELRTWKREDVAAVKADQDHLHFQFFTRKYVQLDDEARTVEHVASDETVDRMGDVILVKGWDLTAFKLNPMLLWAHNGEIPVGRVPKIGKGTYEDRPALLSTSRVNEQSKSLGPVDNEAVWQLVRDGDVPGVSVGFMPLDVYVPETDEERAKLGLGNYGVLFRKQELLELSIAPVPANSNALRRKLEQRVAEGRFDRALFEQISEAWAPRARTLVPVLHPRSAPTEDEAAAERARFSRALEATATLADSVSALIDEHRATRAAVEHMTNQLTAELRAVGERIQELRVAHDPQPPAGSEPVVAPKAVESGLQLKAEQVYEVLMQAADEAFAAQKKA